MKMINRRKFLLTGVASIVATSITPYSFANSLVEFIEPHQNKTMLGHFEQRLNHSFVASNDMHSFNLKLDEVRPYATSVGLEQFELIFKTYSKKDKSGLYQLSKAGTFEKHLVRLEQRGEKNNYSAIFNLLT